MDKVTSELVTTEQIVHHFYCDECGDETMLYEFNGEQLCSDCLVSRFEVVNG